MKLIDKALECGGLSPDEAEEVMDAACPGDLFPELTGMELCISHSNPSKEKCRECWNQEVKEAT